MQLVHFTRNSPTLSGETLQAEDTRGFNAVARVVTPTYLFVFLRKHLRQDGVGRPPGMPKHSAITRPRRTLLDEESEEEGRNKFAGLELVKTMCAGTLHFPGYSSFFSGGYETIEHHVSGVRALP